MPTGCGEQTMLKLAPNVFVFNYLRSTKQVTQQIEATAFNFIRSGKCSAVFSGKVLNLFTQVKSNERFTEGVSVTVDYIVLSSGRNFDLYLSQ